MTLSMTLRFGEHISGLKLQVLEFFLFSYHSSLTRQYSPRPFSYCIHGRQGVQGPSRRLNEILRGSDHIAIFIPYSHVRRGRAKSVRRSGSERGEL